VKNSLDWLIRGLNVDEEESSKIEKWIKLLKFKYKQEKHVCVGGWGGGMRTRTELLRAIWWYWATHM
jgi:hypothetical protein